MRWFIEGGPIMYPLCALFALALPLTLLRLLLHRRTTFPGMTAAVSGTLLGLGLGGAYMGAIQAFDAVAHATPAMKQSLLQVGVELAAIPAEVAAVMCLALVPPNLVAAVRERRPSEAWWGVALAMSVPVALLLGVAVVAGIVSLTSMLELGALFGSATQDAHREASLAQRFSMASTVAVIAAPLAVLAGLLTGLGAAGAAVLAWVRNDRAAGEAEGASR